MDGAEYGNDTDAKAVYQGLLDLIAQAVEARDFDLFQSYIGLPHTVETFAGRQVIADPAQLQHFFDTLCAKLEDAGTSRMMRFCTAAEFQDHSTIHGSHQTRIIGRDVQIKASYPAYSVLRFRAGRWRVCSSQYAETTDQFLNGVLDKTAASHTL